MRNFGGQWTFDKIEIFIKYVKAYLEIMKVHPYWKLIYFDGFAGSGDIIHSDTDEVTLLEGMAKRILQIDDPRSFDIYYFVDKSEDNTKKLEELIEKNFINKSSSIFIVKNDCNIKLIDLANFLNKPENKKHKVLAFIDPYGMQLNWDSIKALEGLPIDMWILVPTGIGVNRLLKKDCQISDEWLNKLKSFLGLSKDEILSYFYSEVIEDTLFGKETKICKEDQAIEKAGILYKKQLLSVFKFISNPFLMRNKTGSILFHFFMASNNATAQKIANDIIKPYYSSY